MVRQRPTAAARRALSYSLLALAACQSQVDAEVALQPGDLLVLFSVDAYGQVLDARHGFFGDPLPTLVVAPEESAYAAIVPEDQRRDPTGRTLPASALSELAVGAGPIPSSAGCGRCPFVPQAPPLLAHPGAVCPLPDFVPLIGLGEGLEAEPRARPWLAWPGRCACADPGPPASSAETDFRLVEPQAFWAPEEVSVNDEGWAGVFSERELLLVDPAGQRYLGPANFPGPVLEAIAAPDRSFWVYTHDQGSTLQASLQRVAVGADGPRVVESWPDRAVWPARLRRIGGELYAPGQDGAERPMLEICRLDSGLTRCSAVGVGAFENVNDTFLDLAELKNGLMVLLLPRGLLLVERRLTSGDEALLSIEGPQTGVFETRAGAVRWRFHPIALDALNPDLGGGELVMGATFGDGLVFCASGARGSYFFEAELPPAALNDPSAVRVVARGGHRPGPCLRMGAVPGQPDHLTISTGAGIWQLGPERRLERYLPTTSTVSYVESEGGPFELRVSAVGEVSRRAPSGRVTALHQTDAPLRPTVSILSGNGEYWVVHPDGARRITAGAGMITAGPMNPLMSVTGSITAAARASDGAIWLAGTPTALYRGPVDGGPPRAVNVAGLSALPPLESLAELGPDRWLGLDAAGKVWVLSDHLEAPVVEADDPSTPSVEALRPNGRARGITTKDGVGWVVGDGAEVFRVHGWSDPPRLERLTFARASQLQYQPDAGRAPPTLTAALATCADRVYLASPANDFTVEERGLLWLLGPDRDFAEPAPAEAPLAFGDLSLRDVAQGNLRTKIKAGRPFAILPGPRRLDLVFQGGQGRGSSHGVGASERTRFADAPTGAASDGQWVLIGTAQGRLYLQVKRGP